MKYRESIANLTHSKLKTVIGETHVLDKEEDVMGNKGKGQNIVMYKTPHKTGLAPDHKKGTEFLNNSPKGGERRKKIIDNETDHN